MVCFVESFVAATNGARRLTGWLAIFVDAAKMTNVTVECSWSAEKRIFGIRNCGKRLLDVRKQRGKSTNSNIPCHCRLACRIRQTPAILPRTYDHASAHHICDICSYCAPPPLAPLTLQTVPHRCFRAQPNRPPVVRSVCQPAKTYRRRRF